jgi:hypothetical protein
MKPLPRAHLGGFRNDHLRFILDSRRIGLARQCAGDQIARRFIACFELLAGYDMTVISGQCSSSYQSHGR